MTMMCVQFDMQTVKVLDSTTKNVLLEGAMSDGLYRLVLPTKHVAQVD